MSLKFRVTELKVILKDFLYALCEGQDNEQRKDRITLKQLKLVTVDVSCEEQRETFCPLCSVGWESVWCQFEEKL